MQGFSMRLSILSVLFLVACGGSGGGGGDDGGGDDSDLDGDFISDGDEGAADDVDSDGDGTPDFQDDDSDDDGIPDYREAGDEDLATPPPDHDGDGAPDFQDTDADGNGRLDGVDGLDDQDGDGDGNFADLDDDGDNINDVLELGDDVNDPTDTDQDGIADFQDEDSDGDTILDLHDRLYDPDGDDIPAFRDLDSDGDCRLDEAEAGDAILATEPVNSDEDTGADFIDLDSDGDGLLDSLEDTNCNGLHDPPESSSTNPDSDGDGVDDLIEEAAGTDANDPTENPQSEGNFVFVVPYVEPPTPDEDTLDFSTNISQADVFFSMDTTGSMGGEIANLETSLVSIVGSLATEIPNVGIGVGYYDDFPTSPYGTAPVDQPFGLLHRVMTVSTTAGRTSVQNGVNALATHNGNDIPESGWEAMHQIATGAGVSVGGANVPAFNPATAPPLTLPPGESFGTLGGVGFRTGSLPIVVAITDATSHSGDYSFAGTATRAQAIAELMSLGVRVIGVVSDAGAARTDINQAVNATGAVVPVSAWDANRPAGCGVTQCCTGINGVGETPTAGMCPLSFLISGTGTGLGNAIVTAIQALANFAVLDVGADIVDNQDAGGETVNAVLSFVDHLAANPAAPAPCTAGLTAVDQSPVDSILDTFTNVQPGSTACFDVIPKMNTTVMATDQPQIYTASINVIGDGVTTLDTRVVYFLVPPEIPDVPVD
jgi:hypothetical protein